MLIDAIQKTLNVFNSMGIASIFVDAKHEQAKKYYDQFDFISLPEQLNNLFLSLSILAKNLNCMT